MSATFATDSNSINGLESENASPSLHSNHPTKLSSLQSLMVPAAQGRNLLDKCKRRLCSKSSARRVTSARTFLAFEDGLLGCHRNASWQSCDLFNLKMPFSSLSPVINP